MRAFRLAVLVFLLLGTFSLTGCLSAHMGHIERFEAAGSLVTGEITPFDQPPIAAGIKPKRGAIRTGNPSRGIENKEPESPGTHGGNPEKEGKKKRPES